MADQGHTLTRIQRLIINEAAECGMSIGVAIPLRSPGRYPLAGMSLSNAMRPAEFDRFMADWGPLAHLAALYAHTRMQTLPQKPAIAISDLALPPREHECLLWVSRGLSSKEISQKVGLGVKTVEYHLAKAMRKLEVTTRSHAVARAIALGLLEP